MATDPLKLPRIQAGTRYFNADGTATQQMQIMWQRLCENTETSVNSQAETLAAIEAAQTAADAANAAAETANTAATTVTAQSNLVSSYPDGATLTATDAGANVTVAISAHDRVYADGTTVAVSGGNVTGLSYSTLYFIYYDDPTRAGGSVTFAATTSETTAAQTGDRHLIGSVTTPAAAAPPTNGDYVRPPGVGDIP